MVKVAVVILNWNGEAFLRKFLPILIQHTDQATARIIVADNHSSDGSLQLLKDEFPAVETLVLDANYGFAGGYNRALAQVQAEYFVLLNSDVEVTSGWLDPILEYMEQHKEVAACQPKIRSYARPEYFEHAGAAGGYIDQYGFPFCRGRIFGSVEKDEGQYDDVAEIFWATGACLMIRSEVFKKVGGLDDHFFAHMEEIDLCWRLNNRGYKLVCIPQSVVYHVGGGTLNSESPHKTYLNFRNNLLLLYKNLQYVHLRRILALRILFDYVAALQFLLKGKKLNAWAVVKARRDYRKMKSMYIEQREENLRHTILHSPSGVFRKSIVLEYYLSSKKRFRDLSF